MPSILIIDDEDKYLELCRRYMPEHNFGAPARNYREAAAVLARADADVDLVLLDVHFDIPEADLIPEDKTALLKGKGAKKALERLRRSQGLHILDRLRQRHPDLPVIVMTAQDDLPLEVDAERLKAEDYTYLLDDDYLDARSLKVQVERALSQRVRSDEDGPFFWGRTRRMQDLRRRIAVLARGQLPMIIQGATGTGKSLLAREFIHGRSERSGPFIAVDLSTIPSELMASHLFGVVKGAFTGATHSRDGVVGRANGGTLFLDEIGNLNLELQKSLLLVLQEGRYRPVGSVEERVADVKLVVATNENLAKMVREGRFREDLFMRLNPATAVTLPSLRDRRDDFEELLGVFLLRVCAEDYNRDLLLRYAEQRGMAALVDDEQGEISVTVGKKVPPRGGSRRALHFLVHPTSFNALRDFTWPGSFRQFEMVLSNLVTFTLVELVDRAAEIEPDDADLASRPEVIPIQPRTVRELLRPWAEAVGEEDGPGADDEEGDLSIALRPAESLNAVSCDVERQYLEWLYRRAGGDLAKVAERLLGDASAGRKVQLRMNQLGIRLRELRREGK